MIKGKRLVVTGRAGFIGSNIVKALLESDNDVTVIDNLSSGYIENISEILPEITFVKGDIEDIELLRDIFKNIDYVINCAALVLVPRSVEDPIESNQININGTLNVLVAAKDTGVAKVIHVSSSAVYGNSPVLPKNEGMTLEPLTPYVITKLAGEQYCKTFYELYRVKTVSLRFFNVFGPYQDPESQYAAVIPKFITRMLKAESPIIYGDGEQSRDFTYVQNNVDATLLACEVKSAAGGIFNIASGKVITLNELVETLNAILNTDIEPEYTKPQLGDVKYSMADISLAQNTLGFEPKYDFEYGMRKTVEWFQNLYLF